MLTTNCDTVIGMLRNCSLYFKLIRKDLSIFLASFYGVVPVFTWEALSGFENCMPMHLSRGTCVSLGGPGPIHSFSEWEKLLGTRYTTRSAVCAMMYPYLLAMCWHHPLVKQRASHQQRAQPDSYFLARIILARIRVEFSIIELCNPLKYVRHCKLTERQTSRASYTA